MNVWPSVPLRHIAHFAYGDSLATDSRDDGDVPVFGSNGQTGRHSKANTLAPVVIVGRKGSQGKVQFSSRPVFAIDTTFFVDSRHTSVDIRWLYYVLSTLGLDSTSRDVGVPGLSREDAYALSVPLPGSVAMQEAIADYLDAETARIDDLIGRKGRLLELQQERRASLVATLLSTESDAVAVWMGSILTAWPLISLGLLAEVFNGTTPEGIDQDVGDVAWVTSGDIDQGVVSHPSGYISEQTRCAHGMRVAPPGSVVVGLIGQGRTRGLSAELGIAAVLNQNIAALVPRDGRLDSEYLRLLLLLAYEDLRNGGRGANQAALNCEILKAYQVPLAPADIQLTLVRTVADAHAKEEAVAEALRRQLNLLKERRQALITAAVTGQIEIPGVAA